jgi:tetratricopeptide (TPR) repeat protein
VAAAVEELYEDRLQEHYETLAHHYYEAGEWQKALEYLLKSAQKAADAYAGHDAINYYERALEAAEQLENVPLGTLAEIHHGKAQVCLVMSEWDVAIQCYGDLVELARNEGDRRVEGVALGGLGFAQTIGHDFMAADQTAKEALQIAVELGDDTVRVGSMMVSTFLVILRGKVADSIPM